jgi:hypothetical protein
MRFERPTHLVLQIVCEWPMWSDRTCADARVRARAGVSTDARRRVLLVVALQSKAEQIIRASAMQCELNCS